MSMGAQPAKPVFLQLRIVFVHETTSLIKVEGSPPAVLLRHRDLYLLSLARLVAHAQI
jgi:hypothetical protein